MKRKLIFLDIDGTLTPAGSNTPPKSAMDAIRAAQKNGHKVFLCTGRNPAMLAPVLPLRQKVRETDVRVVREKLVADLMGDANNEL